MPTVTVLTKVGRNITTGRIKGVGSGVGSAEPAYVAWGTNPSNTTANQDDTTLGAQSGSRVLGASSQYTTTSANDTYQVQGLLTASGPIGIKEAGLFDASSSGNMYLRGTFDAINLENGESIQFTIRVQYT